MPNNQNRNPHPEKNLTEEGRSKGGSNSGGNFKKDPKRAAEAGSHSHDNDGNKSS